MSGSSDRLDRLERALPPTAAVLAWLARAHAFESFDEALAASVAASPGRTPRTRIISQVTAWAVRSRREDRAVSRAAAIDEAVHDALFAYELAATIETTTTALASLLDPTLKLRMRELADDIEDCAGETELGPCDVRHWAADAARLVIGQMRSHDAACRRLAADDLAGREARFPATMASWTRLEVLAELLDDRLEQAPACRAIRPDGVPVDWAIDMEADVTRRVEAMRLEALIESYRYLSETGQVSAIAGRRLADLV